MGTRVEVKFNQDYVATRGAGISGAKGQTRIFADSPDLRKLIDEEIVDKVKTIKPEKKKERKTPAAKREKATRKKREKS